VKILKDGCDGHRVACVTFMVPYNKEGFLTFCLAQVRFTTIIPPYRYSYTEANDIISGATSVTPGSLDDKMKRLLQDLEIISNRNGFKRHRNQNGVAGWLVSVAMNIAGVIMARKMGRDGIWCIYRNDYDEEACTQVSTSFYNPICALKEYSFPFFEDFGYVRGTSPARRFEDYVNQHNCYSADIGKVAPIVGDSLDYCVAAITAMENDKFSRGF